MKTPQTTILFWIAIPKLKTSGLLAEAGAPGYQHRPVMGEIVANALLGLRHRLPYRRSGSRFSRPMGDKTRVHAERWSA
jgi:hypothetical protein